MLQLMILRFWVKMGFQYSREQHHLNNNKRRIKINKKIKRNNDIGQYIKIIYYKY
jgi:hypothetical protein